jgi:hypothetical protein
LTGCKNNSLVVCSVVPGDGVEVMGEDIATFSKRMD